MPPKPTLTEIIELRERLPEPSERRAIRERLHLSQELLARDVGVSLQTLAAWEAGSADPRQANLQAYVALLERLQAEIDARGEG